MRGTADQNRIRLQHCQQRLPELMGVAEEDAMRGQRPAQSKSQAIEVLMEDRGVNPGSFGHGLPKHALHGLGFQFELSYGLAEALRSVGRARREERDAGPFGIHRW